MTTNERQRLTALEGRFAEGLPLSHAEREELESLRDRAGQGWLFRASRSRAPEETAAAPAEGSRLIAFDEGETEDLFGGQQLLL